MYICASASGYVDVHIQQKYMNTNYMVLSYLLEY